MPLNQCLTLSDNIGKRKIKDNIALSNILFFLKSLISAEGSINDIMI